MKTIPIAGTGTVSFFEDDTLEVVRQHIALAVNSHPARIVVEAHVTLPVDYYADPRHWEALFFRVSSDDVTVDKELFRTYVEQVRMLPPMDAPTGKEDWMSKPSTLEALYAPASSFLEWRLLGIPDERCAALPMPPKDLPSFPATRIPVMSSQTLYDTRYRDTDITEFRVTPMSEPTDLVMRIYFPLLQADTPNRLSESEAQSLRTTHNQLASLLALSVPEPPHVAVVRAKWFIPLVETEFAAPRARFEEMFFGLTVNKKTPYVGFFTSKQEQTRHKFFVTDTESKTPYLDLAMWKAWVHNTQPQRRLPTLMVYRGTSRTSFERIAITPKDITFTFWRGKDTNEKLEDTRQDMMLWFRSLDAIVPFVEMADLSLPRWELQDLSLFASFGKDISGFDMRRFPCLRSIFSSQDDTFRLMRAEHLVENMTPQELRAYQVLYESDTSTAQTLVDELGMSQEEAQRMVRTFAALGEEFDLERVMRGYPTLKFSTKEVLISSVTDIDRTLHYASILRYVLTADDAAVDSVCPRRMEAVEASTAAPTVTVQEGNFEIDDEFAAMLGLDEPTPEPTTEKVQEGWVKNKGSRIKLESGEGTTYKYFAQRARNFNGEIFGETYPSTCEKTKQVVVITPEQEQKFTGELAAYNPRNMATMEFKKPDGIAICPQYWCIIDEIPLRADQLVDDACPECGGKVITKKTDRTPEFSIIKRNQDNVFPASYKDKAPCCYKERRSTTTLTRDDANTNDVTYVLQTGTLPSLRIGYIPEELARSIKLRTDYSTSVPRARIEAGNKDFFRVGLGLPRDTLKVLLSKDTTTIPEPKNAKETVMLCSFFRTWSEVGEGDTEVDRILDGIQLAWEQKRMPMLDELEYVTAILKCKVIRLNSKTNSVSCGYWSDTLSPTSRTVVMIDSDLLAHVKRRQTKKADDKFEFKADIQKEPFAKDTAALLNGLHSQACVSNTPDLQAAMNEVRIKGLTSPQFILDPFNRVQAVFVPRVAVLPVQPMSYKPLPGIPARTGYAEIKTDELPTQAALRRFLDSTQHVGFKWVEDLADAEGRPTESLLTSGFRALFRPGAPVEGQTAKEVIGTVAKTPESQLVDGKLNSEDAAKFAEISYAAEVFDFMLFSLSKDVQLTEYTSLRNSILKRDQLLYKRLEAWMTKKSHWEHVDTPKQFVNKIRTPCGQYRQKDVCNTSSLCGWNGNTCRIRVNESVEKKPALLRRLVKTLMENDKQRALVLDERMSPFFSTVLYLEMPHEWITTSV